MHNEKVYTSGKIVDIILDEVGFNAINNIKNKHIIDNSCGNGNFIIKIVERIFEYVSNVNKTYLETYVHGIDIDEEAVNECTKRLNEYCNSKGITDVNWDVRVSNALTDKSYEGKMDYVVGNPPYCKVHHLDKETYNILKKDFLFCKDSMTDLFIAFFEIGIKMMKEENGKLGYITPNSWLISKAANELRKYLVKSEKIKKVIDFKTDKVFPNATTFTNITILGNDDKQSVYYYNGDLKDYTFKKLYKFNNIEQAYFNEQLYFNEKLSKVKDIINYDSKDKLFSVKNGLATLKDKLFIMEYGELDEQMQYYVLLYNNSIIDCVKASTGKSKFIIYPYGKNGKPLKYEEISLLTRDILEKKAKDLEIDTTKEDWFLYGRTQALNDVSKYKVSVNNIVRTKNDIRVCEAQKNVAVYSGFYVIKNDMEQTDEESKELKIQIETAMKDDLFFEYLNVVGKSKNGGYYAFTTKDLEKYLNYFYMFSELF